MGLTNTAGNYCFVQCDGFDCTKKIEHVDKKALARLAAICGWAREGNRWFCPDCAEQAGLKSS